MLQTELNSNQLSAFSNQLSAAFPLKDIMSSDIIYFQEVAVNRILLSILVLLSFIFLFWIVPITHGYSQQDLDQLKSTKQCSACDLSNAPLANTNLTRANLERANLFSANLSKANLSGANLSGANCMNASLPGASLVSANLKSANLTGANLSGANLSGANLSLAVWTDGLICKEGSIGTCKK